MVVVWQPFDVGFELLGGLEFDAAEIDAVRKAAEDRRGGSITCRCGRNPRARPGDRCHATPTWKGLWQSGGRT